MIMFQIIPVLIWLLIIEFLCFLMTPILFRIFKNLKDKGLVFSKSIGILLSTYFTWIIVNLGISEYSALSIILSILLIASVSIWSFIKSKKEIMDFVRNNIKYLLLVELLFISSFLSFTIVRYFDNSIVDAEKPQDFMLLNCILRTKAFPLNDCWFTGEKMQYYYFGHMMVSNLTKISGISSGITYNLAIPLFFSLTLINSFSIIYNLTKKKGSALLGSILVSFIGNFRGLFQVVETGRFIPFNYWSSAHYIIPGTINEFPYFSFLHADMHPHMMAIPFTLICIGLVLNLIKSKKKSKDLLKSDLPEIIILSLLIGSLAFINTWDYPTYLGLTLVVILIQQCLQNSKKVNLSLIKNTLILSSVVVILSLILFLPYHLSVKSTRAIGFTSQKTLTKHYLIIYGLFLFVSLTYLYFYSKKNKILEIKTQKFNISIPISIAALLIITFGLLNIPLVSLFLILVIFGILLWKKIGLKKINRENIFAITLFFISIGLLIVIEFLFVDDSFTGDLERVNTVFKVGMQIWVLMSISSSYFFYYIKNNFLKRGTISNIIWTGTFILLLLFSLIYPVFATYSKTKNGYNFFGKSKTLDGRDYLKNVDFCDYDAIKWINENIEDTPVILESKGQSFQWTSCVSFNTGLPTLVGWEGHEQQWRPKSLDKISKRAVDIDKIYNNQSMELIEKYNISYIYVGKLEKDKYSEENLNQFNDLFDLVYNTTEAKIYKVD
ncbi:MAG: hypothetical protein GF368_05070 [Candidatus Aenigmarchaeota archaeon]|nr:hypothetical protein [Candidatus Aenigmarchaeota archaeon]